MPAPEAGVACTSIVSPNTPVQPVADQTKPGDVVCLRAGSHGPFIITQSGTQAAPITFRAYPGEEQQAGITVNNYKQEQGIRVDQAHHIVIEGLWVTQVNQGIFVSHSDQVTVSNCKVTQIGQECVRFKFSDHGAIVGNTIQACGRRSLSEGRNGEGIYLGSGDEPGDDTHDVLVKGNTVMDTMDEGIELKGSTKDCVVELNRVHDLLIQDGGGIKVAKAESTDPGLVNSGHIVRANIVYNVQTRTQYVDGNGICIQRGALVYNNVCYGNQHHGIRVDDKLALQGIVKIYHNTLYDNGTSPIGLYDGIVPDIRNNLGPSQTDNLAATSGLFVDAAGGDFHLVSGAAAIDAAGDVGVTEDLEGTPRPQGSMFDLGAYEFQ